MQWIELVAAGFGLGCVVLTIRENIWCWPTGLVQVVLYIFVFYEARLYSDALLHVVYVVLQIYGWHHWLRGGPARDALPVTGLGARFPRWIAAVLAISAAWGYGMARWTDAALPYGDAFTTMASLAAQWLLARKKLESWLLWISVDVVAIGIYAYKELYFTTGLYAIFLALATIGYFGWRRAMRGKGVASPAASSDA